MQRAAELKSQLDAEIAKYEEVEVEINTLMEVLPERAKEVSTCVQEVKYAALCEETMFSLLEAKGEKPQQQIGFYGEDFYCKPMSVQLPSFEMKKLTCIYYYGQLIYRGEN